MRLLHFHHFLHHFRYANGSKWGFVFILLPTPRVEITNHLVVVPRRRFNSPSGTCSRIFYSLCEYPCGFPQKDVFFSAALSDYMRFLGGFWSFQTFQTVGTTRRCRVLCTVRAAGLSLWATASGPDQEYCGDPVWPRWSPLYFGGDFGCVVAASFCIFPQAPSAPQVPRLIAKNASRLCVFCPAYLLKHIRDFGWAPMLLRFGKREACCERSGMVGVQYFIATIYYPRRQDQRPTGWGVVIPSRLARLEHPIVRGLNPPWSGFC